MADRDLIDAVHALLFEALTAPAREEVAALQEADRLCHDLQDRLGGHRYYLPRPDKEPRNLRIATELRAGKSQREVAAAHGVSVATVNSVAKAVSPETETAGGFGSDDWNGRM